jgi:flagellar hook-associated protein 2
MSMAIDGLVSGMSTTEMVSQLMQLEAMPQTALKNKITAQNKAVTAFQAVNTKMAALTTAAKALGEAATWDAVKATSSSDAAIVTATPGTVTGSLSFTVDKLATAHTLTYKDATVTAVTGQVTDQASITVPTVPLSGGGTVSVPTGDMSLGDVVDAINNAEGKPAYKAAAIQIRPGEYTLQLTAVATGDNPFQFSEPVEINLLGTSTPTTVGADAELNVGDPGFTVTSSGNTFTDLLPGLNVTVTKTTATPVTVSVTENPDAIAGKVEALVNAANAALSEIRTQTAKKTDTTAAGPLVGDTAVRSLYQEILSSVAAGAGTNGSLAAVGIELDRAGSLTFKKDEFLKAYAEDPDTAVKFFTDFDDDDADEKFDPGLETAFGLAHKLMALGQRATTGIADQDDPTAPVEGTLAGIIKRRNESIAGLNDQVAAWDVRLATRKANLQRQFSSLEVALGKMQQQSNWLAGQIAGLA